MCWNRCKTAYLTIYRSCAGFVWDIHTVVAVVVWRLSCGDMPVSLSDLTSLHGQINCVLLIHPVVCWKPARFSRSSACISFFILFAWMVNCRTFIVVVELCATVYLRVLGRKLDAGQCVTLGGAAFTRPRWRAAQTPRCPRLVRARLSGGGDPFNIPSLCVL